jgi:tetratricopeptide (TPR) repeat protein
MKKYADVLALKPKGMKDLMNKSAVLLLTETIDHKQCDKAIDLYKKYQITLGEHLENGVYDCAMQTLNYKIARDIAQPHVTSTVLTKRMKWLYRYALADYNLEKYAKTITAGEDLGVLIGSDKTSPYNKIYRTLFDSYAKLKKHSKMIATINKIVSIFGVNYDDITRYMQMVNLGTKLKDDTMIITYGGYVYHLQEKAKVYLQTPFIEFTLSQAYIDENHLNKAVSILSSLDKRDLKPSERARQQYLLGSLLQRLWRNAEAKKAFEASIKADKNSPWAQLAAKAMKLM